MRVITFFIKSIQNRFFKNGAEEWNESGIPAAVVSP